MSHNYFIKTIPTEDKMPGTPSWVSETTYANYDDAVNVVTALRNAGCGSFWYIVSEDDSLYSILTRYGVIPETQSIRSPTVPPLFRLYTMDAPVLGSAKKRKVMGVKH